MLPRACLALLLFILSAAGATAQERLGVRLWADIEIVGILRVVGDEVLLNTEEENRQVDGSRIILRPAVWSLGRSDIKTLAKFRPLEGRKVVAAGKGLFVPENSFFLGVPIQTIRLERQL